MFWLSMPFSDLTLGNSVTGSRDPSSNFLAYIRIKSSLAIFARFGVTFNQYSSAAAQQCAEVAPWYTGSSVRRYLVRFLPMFGPPLVDGHVLDRRGKCNVSKPLPRTCVLSNL